MPEDGSLFAILPTGSGKTQIAEAVAYQCRSGTKRTVVLVVPTIALAIDLDERLRRNYTSLPSLISEGSWAWVSGVDDERRKEIALGLETGTFPFLITSPESLTTNSLLSNHLRKAVEGGRLGAFVIDEAHLFTQWVGPLQGIVRLPDSGKTYKIEHRIWEFKTICMTATMGSEEMLDLIEHFGSKKQFRGRLFFSQRTRFWIVKDQTQQRSLEF